MTESRIERKLFESKSNCNQSASVAERLASLAVDREAGVPASEMTVLFIMEKEVVDTLQV